MAEGIAAAKGGRAETIQVEYNLLQQEPAQEIFPLAQEADIGIIARVPLRRGLLTGKMTLADENRFQGEDLRARSFRGEAFVRELAKVEKLRFLVRGPIKTLGQAAIAFCAAHPAVSVTIPGARDDHQMRENAAAGDLTLPPEDLERIAELWRSGVLS
jgi:aryl-alcohol dehydrogenase-like predicted oxidoreductase